ncbi:hypothetical protein [Pseudoroseomonas ludipueritiae]|uniref:Uncharacterized protein n=1 Tax=Pseudoroseomonas ludipueritiae TaxID=198093 RepID=A0ABR7R373_9PROT|nr:hypothetical protein [Pseudoroseomonas ludipueritiae]MBC9176178.1 hypothetical protein [Pseudoroseomonas ludipueritiae]
MDATRTVPSPEDEAELDAILGLLLDEAAADVERCDYRDLSGPELWAYLNDRG